MKTCFAASFIMGVIAFVIQAVAEANAADHATTSAVSPFVLALGWVSTALAAGVVARNWHTTSRCYV